MLVQAIKGLMERLPQSEDDRLHAIHDNAPRHYSPNVSSILEKCFGDYVGRIQKVAEHPRSRNRKERYKLWHRTPPSQSLISVLT